MKTQHKRTADNKVLEKKQRLYICEEYHIVVVRVDHDISVLHLQIDSEQGDEAGRRLISGI